MNDHNASNDSEAMTTRERTRARIMKELESLEEDNSGKMERDRMIIWRKLQKCWRPYLGSPIGTVIVTRYMVFECACIYFHCDITLDIT